MVLVKPRPLRTLPKVVEIKINGHNQASIVIKSPASLELKKCSPIKEPVNMNPKVQKMPKILQYFNVLLVSRLIFLRLFCDFALAIIGKSIFATAQVMVVGNKIKGNAIAVRIP